MSEQLRVRRENDIKIKQQAKLEYEQHQTDLKKKIKKLTLKGEVEKKLKQIADESSSSSEEEEGEQEIISDNNFIIAQCTEWKKLYSVIKGVSWGNLPYDLQKKWVKYSCDYHINTELSN